MKTTSNLFNCDEELDQFVEEFLNENRIIKKFKGRQFLKDMIIYSVNYNNEYYCLPNIEQTYRRVQVKNDEKTWFNVRRLADYACNDFYKRNGNKSLATAPSVFLMKAVLFVNEKREEIKRNEN